MGLLPEFDPHPTLSQRERDFLVIAGIVLRVAHFRANLDLRRSLRRSFPYPLGQLRPAQRFGYLCCRGRRRNLEDAGWRLALDPPAGLRALRTVLYSHTRPTISRRALRGNRRRPKPAPAAGYRAFTRCGKDVDIFSPLHQSSRMCDCRRSDKL